MAESMAKPEFDWGPQFDECLATLNSKDEARIRALIDRVEKQSI
ncbi:hypothetical protein [Loigolactobacillus jiayinensis]|uniref:Uncharacterized protein n=1 Tax=Loigolactobacillus jiayinensis TaxID=2486016 RepID=A0ABW1RA59_9LACO|nr:hypothetical protein [Loigolactobacillus jiayinensis]